MENILKFIILAFFQLFLFAYVFLLYLFKKKGVKKIIVFYTVITPAYMCLLIFILAKLQFQNIFLNTNLIAHACIGFSVFAVLVGIYDGIKKRKQSHKAHINENKS